MSDDGVVVAAAVGPAESEPFNRAYIVKMNQAEREPAEPAAPALESAELPLVEDAKAAEPTPDAKLGERDEKGQFKAKKAGNPRHDPQARVHEATAEAAEAKRERAEAQARIAELERRLAEREREAAPVAATPKPTPAGKPTLDQFMSEADPYAALAEATGEWAAKRVLAEDRAAQAAQSVERAHAERFQQAFAEDASLPGLMAAADAALVQAGADPRAPFPAVMLDAIKASAMGPEIARYLGSHPEDLVQLARDVFETPRSAATAVRRLLEATVKASTPSPTAGGTTGTAAALPRPAAVPITPVRTSHEPAPERDPSEIPFGRAYVQRMNAKERRQGA